MQMPMFLIPMFGSLSIPNVHLYLTKNVYYRCIRNSSSRELQHLETLQGGRAEVTMLRHASQGSVGVRQNLDWRGGLEGPKSPQRGVARRKKRLT